jgi:diguanylate cyclase (GGDEF)-like protein/PAS domain S-box-containing protein
MRNQAEGTGARDGSPGPARGQEAALTCAPAMRAGQDSAGRQLPCLSVGGWLRMWTRGDSRPRFADLPVRCRIVLMFLSIGVLGMVVEFSVLVLYQRHTLQMEVVREGGTTVGWLAANAAPAVSAGDRSAAETALGALSIEDQVMAATLYDGGGRVLAEYRRAGEGAANPAWTPLADGGRFNGHILTLSDGVFLRGQRVGSVALVYDVATAQARLHRHFRVALWLLLLSVVIRVIVVMRLSRMVTDPLGYLANVAHSISLGRDYSVRAERRTGGEIGVLIDAFNEMLAQIEKHDRARRAAETGLRESEERYAIAARGSSDGLWDWRMETGQVYFSARMNAMVGEPEVERWGSPEELFDRIHPADRERVHAEFAAFRTSGPAAFEIECRMKHSHGGYLWVLARGTAVRDEHGQIVRTAGSVNDITRRKTRDPITGLRNRLFFLDRLQAAVEAAQRDASRYAVLILNLDHFRMVNDGLGRPASDELLKQVAGRLRSMVRASGREVAVARTGEDEFGMLLTGLRQTCDAESVARDTLKLLREPYYIEGRRVPVGGSMGIAFGSPSDGPEELLRNAETAMYDASTKENGKFAIFNPSMRERATARLDVVMGLRRAIEANQLRLRFQPLVSLRERRIIGFESLVRWQHPDRGLLQPVEFIPVAEESDLILEVGEWVLRESCRQMAEWQERLAPDPPLTIGVNVAARQMNDPGFAELVRRVLAETGMAAKRLRLEVTETSLATDSGQVLATLRALKRMDISMVIDDFGTGYSSLSYLQRLPFNTLKIDRSFTRELGAGDGSPEIVRTIIQLARTLKLKVVAEGVETADQVTRLTALGCDLLQGFYFGKPADVEHTEAMIRDRDALHPVFPYGEEGDYHTDEENSSRAAQPAWLVDQSN